MGKAKASQKSSGADRQVRISKAMSLILRHTALDMGLQVQPDGCVSVKELLACQTMRKLAATAEDIEEITRASDKQRFETKRGQGELLVRAVQGHSMKAVQDEASLRRLRAEDADLPKECVHGTYRRYLEAILDQGLKAGGKQGQSQRNHVHFAPRAPAGEVISGMRADCQVAIWLDLAAAIRSGIPFYMAKNDVILSPGTDGIVPAEFFEKVLDLKTGANLLPATTLENPPAKEHMAATPIVGHAEELTAGLARYQQKGARAAAKTGAHAEPLDSQGSYAAEILKIPSPAAHGSPAQELLTRLVWQGGAPAAGGGSSGQFECAVIYLHGFPDQSLDHRVEHENYGSFSSRFPRKLAEAVLADVPSTLFVAFNFAGTPGSDGSCEFATKTVSREVSDARAVLRFLRESGRLPAPAPCHFVGLSTGAIVASLLRGDDPHMTVTAVAGLVDVKKGLHYDFDEEQLRGFDCQGHCLKEFWLPTDSPSNPNAILAPSEAQGPSQGSWQKHLLRLDAQYREDFLGLDVARAVRSADCPMLVIHGEADTNVPVASGEALFSAAAGPKQSLTIKGGNHLLSNTKHFQKAARAITDMMKHYLPAD